MIDLWKRRTILSAYVATAAWNFTSFACAATEHSPSPRVPGCEESNDEAAWRVAVRTFRGPELEDLHATALAAGGDETCAIARDGNVWCWGTSDEKLYSSAPRIVPLAAQAVAIDGTANWFCAVLSDGQVACWSDGDEVEPAIEDKRAISLAMAGRTLVVRYDDASYGCSTSNGTACDERTFNGVIADGDMVCIGSHDVRRSNDCSGWDERAFRLGATPQRCDNRAPSGECDAGSQATIPAATGCRLITGEEVECAGIADWDAGRGAGARLNESRGRAARRAQAPTEPMATKRRIRLPEDTVQLVGGYSHACVLGRSGSVYCWGSNASGQVGLAPTAHAAVAVPVAITNVAEIDATDETFCAVDNEGGLWCWGRTDGPYEPACTTSPVRRGSFPGAHSLSVGNGAACVIADDDIRCVGVDPKKAKLIPRGPVARRLWRRGPVRDISLGNDLCAIAGELAVCRDVTDSCDRRCRDRRWRVLHDTKEIDEGCLRSADGSLQCYGDDRRSYVNLEFREPVLQVRGHASGWCARRSSGDVTCWTDWSDAIERFQGLDAVDVAFSGGDACVATSSGSVKCWQGGDPPRTIAGLSGAKRVAVGRSSGCALLEDSSVACWGDGDAVLGRGYFAYAPEPLVVVVPRDADPPAPEQRPSPDLRDLVETLDAGGVWRRESGAAALPR